jgi:hypothetical protein
MTTAALDRNSKQVTYWSLIVAVIVIIGIAYAMRDRVRIPDFDLDVGANKANAAATPMDTDYLNLYRNGIYFNNTGVTSPNTFYDPSATGPTNVAPGSTYNTPSINGGINPSGVNDGNIRTNNGGAMGTNSSINPKNNTGVVPQGVNR